MSDKPTPEVEPVPVYTDLEVTEIMKTLQKIYALDDAMYNQEQLKRPTSYFAPLMDIRKDLTDRMNTLTSKGNPPVAEKK